MSFLDDAKKLSNATNDRHLNQLELAEVADRKAVSDQCLAITTTLKEDIVKEAKGTEENSGFSMGRLKYRIIDRTGQAGHFTAGEQAAIEAVEGYASLLKACTDLGLKLEIEISDSDWQSSDCPFTFYFMDIVITGWD